MSNPNADVLKVNLSNIFVLYIKTLNYHWHMKGDSFYETHLLLEKQYKELATAIDEIGESIVIYGEKAPASMSEYLKLATLKEADGSKNDSLSMLMELAEDHKTLAHGLLKVVESKTLDPITEDILIQQAKEHTKNAWMLGSFKK